MPKRKSRPTKVNYSESESEYDDEIQTYHKQQDKILLDSDLQGQSESSEEEEVYGIDDSDSEDEEIGQMQQQLRQIKRNKVKKKLGSDLEDDTEDEALPDSRAWGSKKSWFMGGDVRDNKIILSGEEDEAGAAAMEEKEMKEIEKRQLQRMSEEDYLPPSLMMRLKAKEEKKKKKQGKTEATEESDEEAGKQSEEATGKMKTKKTKSPVETGIDELEKIQIETDFSKLPKEAEFERMKDIHPEYLPLWKDFGLKMGELQNRIQPLMGLVRRGMIEGLGAAYLKMKYHIICNYLLCGGFYVYFMAKRTPRIHHHPVMKRLLELQQFYKRLAPLDKTVRADLDRILERVQQGKEVGKVRCTVGDGEDSSMVTGDRKRHRARQEGPAGKKRKVQFSQDPDLEEDEEDDEGDDKEMGADDDDNEQERRAITYEMEKNKGLTAHKKKELKNPRVKHRKKYRRALIRRKGQVRDFKPPKTAYTGEMTGIRAGIIRSRKLK